MDYNTCGQRLLWWHLLEYTRRYSGENWRSFLDAVGN